MWSLMMSQEAGRQDFETRLARARAELMALRRQPGASHDGLDPALVPLGGKAGSKRTAAHSPAKKRSVPPREKS